MPAVSICVLTYGDYLPLVQRCIESIVRFCPREEYRLLVGANEASLATLTYLRDLEANGTVDHLVVSEENINKCPMMRQLFERVETEFIWWFDDDSFLTSPEPFLRWIDCARQAPVSTVMWGHVFFFSHEKEFSYGQDIRAWVRSAPWFNGKEPPSWTPGGKGLLEFQGRPGGDGRWFFATGGCWLARKWAMDEVDWPDRRLIKAADDVMLAEAIRQQGWHVQDMGSSGLVINHHARRGDGEGKATMSRQVAEKAQPTKSSPGSALLFQITVADETPEQLEWCLKHLREFYPRSVALVVADGVCHPELAARAKRFGATFFRGRKLGLPSQEAAWWNRFFTEALKYGPDTIVRLDARTRIWRRFPIPEGAEFFGFIVNEGTTEEHVHAGCQGFSRRFAELAVAGGIDAVAQSQKDLMGRPNGSSENGFRDGNGAKENSVSGSRLPALEVEITATAQRLGLPWAPHPGFWVSAGAEAPENDNRRYAVTHPHLVSPPKQTRWPVPVEVVIMNWRRPANVRRIVEAFAAQAQHCRITLIDSAASPEYALDAATLKLANRHFIFSHNFGSFNRFVPSLGYTARFTLFHDDDLLPGKDAIEHLLAAARQRPEFSVLGEFGRRVTEDGEEQVQDTERAPGECREADFLVRSYFVKTANLRHVWNAIDDMKLNSQGCEDDLLLCASIQRATGWPCLVTPSGTPDQSLAREHLPEPFALWHRTDHFHRRGHFLQSLLRAGWKPMAAKERQSLQAPFMAKVRRPAAMNQRRYSVVAYRQSGNLGDAMQTYAISRLMPGNCSAIYRDEAGRIAIPNPVIMNGWLGLNPGAKTFAAAFAGVFIGADDDDNLHWMKSLSSGPHIGARDPFTQERLQSSGIPARMIGCATLTLPRYFGARRGVLHIDDDTEGCLTQVIPEEMSWEEQWRLAKLRIRQLAEAAAVYTTRLHIALPCLALGTPVCFYPRGHQAAERFSILEYLGARPGELAWIDVSRQAQIYREFVAETIGAELAAHEEPTMPAPKEALSGRRSQGSPSPRGRLTRACCESGSPWERKFCCS